MISPLFHFVWTGMLLATAGSCSGDPTASTQEFPVMLTMRVGDTTRVGGSDLTLSFEEVRNDSRCPKDVVCVVAGQATVVFTARAGTRAEALTFEIPPDGSDTERFEDFSITIESLEPPTESTRLIEQEDYLAHVRVEHDEP